MTSSALAPRPTVAPPLPRPVTDDVRRREFFGVLAAAGLLTGCAEEATGAGRTAPGFPRDVPHGEGVVTLDAAPERVYTFGGAFALDGLLAHGVLPACCSAYQSELLPWQDVPGMADVPIAVEGAAAEQLASLGVDFALLSDFEWASAAGAQARAYCPSATPVLPTSTEDLLLLWGRILGRDGAAADLVADHAAAVAELQAPPGRSATALHAMEGGAFVYQPDFEVARTMELAGLPVRLFPEQDGASFELSLENLGSLDAEVLVLLQPYGPDPAAAALQAQPLFQSLPAVQAGRSVVLDTADSSALLAPTSLALPTTAAVLDRLRAL